MSVLARLFRQWLWNTIRFSLVVFAVSGQANPALATKPTISNLRGRWSGSLLTRFGGHQVAGRVQLDFIDDQHVVVWMPERENGDYEMIGQQIWVRFGSDFVA